MPIEVTYYTDPGCSWSWGSRAEASQADVGVRRRAALSLGDGRARARVRRRLPRRGERDHRHGRAASTGLMAHGSTSPRRRGMPLDPRIWRHDPIASHLPRMPRGEGRRRAGPRARVRLPAPAARGADGERRKLDHVEALVGEAGPGGARRRPLPHRRRLERDHRGLRVRPRRGPQPSRRGARGRDRSRRPRAATSASASPRWCSPASDGSRHGVWGWSPYEAYREAARRPARSRAGAGRPPERRRGGRALRTR